jgi:hypothetical protein
MELTLLTEIPEGVTDAGLDATDPRFVEIASLVEGGEYDAAAAAAEGLLREGILDVRVIGYYGYGAFLEGGVGALGPVAEALSDLLGTRLDALGPAANKLKHARTSLGWFLKQLTRKLEREEAGRGEDGPSSPPTSADDIHAALAGFERLGGTIEKVFGEGAGLMEQVGKLTLLLERRRAVVEKTPATEAAPDADLPAEVLPRSERAIVRPEPLEPRQEALALPGSRALGELQGKLKAFEELLAEGKLPHARIVADDIQAVIEHFDPCLYFPELFGSFLRLAATSADDLAQAEEQRETPRFKALAAYYRVDLEGFKSL